MAYEVDDADLDCVAATPRYGGPPSRFLDPVVLERAKALLLAGERAGDVAQAIGYGHLPTFSDAFLRVTGKRPSVWQALHGVKPRRRSGGRRMLGRRSVPDRSGEVPLPRYPTDDATAKKPGQPTVRVLTGVCKPDFL